MYGLVQQTQTLFKIDIKINHMYIFYTISLHIIVVQIYCVRVGKSSTLYGICERF